ncbi:ABC1 family-domain-containing protein [Scheffersomyces amazonensis]|uniref:ABC1 family-domain-containing protein n=1 Tax=Scheffersomyces amazonensis TaxID=1078765 RepID=UPI00315C83DC
MFRQVLRQRVKPLSFSALKWSPQITRSFTKSIRVNKPIIESSIFPRSRILKSLTIVIGVGGSVYIIDKYAYSSLITRSVRALYVLLWIAYEYGLNTASYSNINDLHEKCAESLLDLLMKNKGLYIKLGQAIANQGSIFPLAYQIRFEKMYDDAPIESWSKIDNVLKQNLGANYESEIFESIDHDPVASASIAQVHKAVLKGSGEKVAVKIQHSYIGNQIVIDLFIYRFMAKIYEKVFELPMSMFTSYVSKQMQLEVNFINELGNAEKLRELLDNDPTLSNINVYIPKNYRDVSTEQILVSEWIEGISLVEKQKLLDLGYNVSLMMKQYLTIFGRQIFKYGFVHSDPHPGDLLARFDKNGKQQLVVLDHGLYISLPDKFRVEYCNLWRYLFSYNKEGIEDIGRNWGIQAIELFSTLVQLRPPVLDQTKIDNDKRNVNSLFQDFIGDESRFPLELLFLARTMRMIQTLNQGFGSPVNRINLLTKASVDALATEKSLKFNEYFDVILIRLNIFFSGLIFFLIRLRQVLLGDRYGGKGKGFEDYIEVYLQNTAKSLGIDM